jgi:hypothetical protein
MFMCDLNKCKSSDVFLRESTFTYWRTATFPTGLIAFPFIIILSCVLLVTRDNYAHTVTTRNERPAVYAMISHASQKAAISCEEETQ